VLLSEGQNSGR